MSIFKQQLLLILAGVFIGILIYCAPKKESGEDSITTAAESVTSEANEHEGHDHGEEETDVLSGLSDNDKELFSALEVKAEQVSDIDTKLNLYDSLIQFSIKNNLPPLVAKFTEKKAMAVPTETNWMLAGDNYFKAFRLSKNSSKELIAAAISNYDKVLELNSENLDAQTAIGVAYVEGASQLEEMPMKGIGILKEVLNKDPKNVNALTNLGYFAIQSGQYEKAIERFETVLSIDPQNAEAYIYLTDTYLSQGDVEKGIETLEKYKSLVNDPLVQQQVDDYIKEIRNK